VLSGNDVKVSEDLTSLQSSFEIPALAACTGPSYLQVCSDPARPITCAVPLFGNIATAEDNLLTGKSVKVDVTYSCNLGSIGPVPLFGFERTQMAMRHGLPPDVEARGCLQGGSVTVFVDGEQVTSDGSASWRQWCSR
jgi:hypothetical protein